MNGRRVISNIIWRLAERMGAQMVAFVVSVILARVLEPEVYGTVALITVIIAVLQVFVDSGLGNALIQKKDADDLDFSTVFYVNIVFCILLYTVLFLFAPCIAKYYENTAITPYIRVLGLTVIVSGVKNVQQAYVSNNMLFKKFFFSTMAGTIIAGIVGIIMALSGAGIWALVMQHLINLTIDTAVLWITVKWRPKAEFSFERLRGLYSYGWKLLASGLLDTLYNNIRQLAIGKIYSPTDLAQYNRGRQFPDLIVSNVNASIDSVLFPTMSNEQNNTGSLKVITRRALKTSTYVMAPLLIGLAFVGEPFVKWLLTEKWLPCVLYMRIFCISFLFWPIHTVNLNAIKALGRSDLYLKLEVWKKVVGVIALLSTMWVSVEAMAYSLLATSLFGQIVNSMPNKKLIDYGYFQQLRDILPAVLLSVLMGCCVYPIQYLGFGSFATLIMQVFLGMVIYVSGSVIFKMDSFYYLWELVGSHIKNRKG